MQEAALFPGGIPELVYGVAGWAWDMLPIRPSDRTHWTGLTAFFVLGTAVYVAARMRGDQRASGSLVSFLVPSKIYLSRSSLLDVKVYLANRLVQPVLVLVSGSVRLTLVIVIAEAVGSRMHEGSDGILPLPMLALATLTATLAADLAYYITHRMYHESPLLWPFHKLHHSAEYLTPLTAKRNHPVFDLTLGIVRALLIAPVMGIIFGLFGVFDVMTVLGLGLIIAVFNFAGGALRHSHIWLDYGPVLDRIFISPAQHQIHHSMAVQHHDRNYGLIFAIWDWAFGTLYVPNGREELTFGVANADGVPEPQVHTSLVTAYLVPFAESARTLRARSPAQPFPAE